MCCMYIPFSQQLGPCSEAKTSIVKILLAVWEATLFPSGFTLYGTTRLCSIARQLRWNFPPNAHVLYVRSASVSQFRLADSFAHKAKIVFPGNISGRTFLGRLQCSSTICTFRLSPPSGFVLIKHTRLCDPHTGRIPLLSAGTATLAPSLMTPNTIFAEWSKVRAI